MARKNNNYCKLTSPKSLNSYPSTMLRTGIKGICDIMQRLLILSESLMNQVRIIFIQNTTSFQLSYRRQQRRSFLWQPEDSAVVTTYIMARLKGFNMHTTFHKVFLKSG
ncbi:MAG: hypothetical protein AABZ11_10840 [Nitrospinota bacterium]